QTSLQGNDKLIIAFDPGQFVSSPPALPRTLHKAGKTMTDKHSGTDGHYGFSFEKPRIGTSSRGGLTYADILTADGQVVPPALGTGDHVPARCLVSYDRYIDPQFVALET